MPIFDSFRINQNGTGAVYFTSTQFANSSVSATSNGATFANSLSLVSGENVGNGIGLFAGTITTTNVTYMLEFKSILAGAGIDLTDTGGALLIAANGEITPQTFVSLTDGPMDIVGNAVLFGNAASNTVQWTTPATNNTVLSYVNNSFTWLSPLGSLIGNGDNAIHVVATTLSNGYSINVTLNNTTVIPGNYNFANVTVDQQGRITAISNSNANALATTFFVNTDSNIVVSGSPIVNNGTLNIALSNTTVIPGTYAYTTVTVDQKGRIQNIANGISPIGNLALAGTVDIGVAGSFANSNVVVSLLPTAVSAGIYSFATITVDSKGRLQNAVSSNAISRVALIGDSNFTIAGSPITSAGTFGIGLTTTGITAGTYDNAQFIVDKYGRLSNAISNPSTLIFTSIANTANTFNLYAGASNSVQYFSILEASSNVTITAIDTNVFGGQLANSGILILDLSNTGIIAGTYTTLVVDSKGRATAGANIDPGLVTLTGDVIANVSAFTPGYYSNSTYVPALLNTVLEEYVQDSLGNLVHGPSTFTKVIVDSKGRVMTGTLATNTATGSLINLSGDVFAFGNATAMTSVNATLANSGVSAGTYTQVVVNAKGLVTSASNAAAVPTNVSLVGDVSGNGSTGNSIVTTLATVVTAGTYSTVTVNSKGLVISGTNTSQNQPITISGDASGTGATAINLTLATLSPPVGGTYASVVVNGKGLVISGNTIVNYSLLPLELQTVPLAFGYVGSPPASTTFGIAIAQNILIANSAGSVGYAITASAGAATFTLAYIHAGTSHPIGTVVFNHSSNSPTFSTFTAVNLVPGDFLYMTSPSTQDATLATIGITILAYRQ